MHFPSSAPLGSTHPLAAEAMPASVCSHPPCTGAFEHHLQTLFSYFSDYYPVADAHCPNILRFEEDMPATGHQVAVPVLDSSLPLSSLLSQYFQYPNGVQRRHSTILSSATLVSTTATLCSNQMPQAHNSTTHLRDSFSPEKWLYQSTRYHPQYTALSSNTFAQTYQHSTGFLDWQHVPLRCSQSVLLQETHDQNPNRSCNHPSIEQPHAHEAQHF
mmetsp:Transcript_3810/g.7751  ORF Transcript_3810/g.7751 Transcript_3810/m.7751 type:complete len:216 (-) Transcript_3810:278-925(-)